MSEKILFITTKSENGGAQKWTKEQIEICSNTFQCFLATDENGWLSKNVLVKNKFLNKLIYKRVSLLYLLKLNQFVKDNNIDLIIASSANAGIYSRLIKLLNKKVKIIYVSHGWSSIYNGGKLAFLYTFIEKQLSKLSDSILCISNKDFDNAKKVISIKEKKLKWITNKIYPTKKIIKDTSINKIKLLTVARLTPPKRVDLLIDATKDLDIELHVVGNGFLMDSLIEQKHNNVYFHGEINGFNDFTSFDIFALISDSEGLPLSALEAMDASLPIILSNVGGCFELIEKNGILVENNVDMIKKAIEISIVNKDSFSKQSKLLFDKKFNLESSKREYLDYYKKVLES